METVPFSVVDLKRLLELLDRRAASRRANVISLETERKKRAELARDKPRSRPQSSAGREGNQREDE